MNFSYKESRSGYDMLAIKTDQHVELEILFDGGDADQIYIDGDEFPVISDTLNGLFVVIAGEFKTLAQVCTQANIDYDDIMKEVRDEQKAEDDMARELSSPYLTGRI